MAQMAVGLRIEGRVQGVGFRAFVVRRATGLGVSGWVRNRTDGSVEVKAMGEIEAVEALVAACGVGPRGAVVRVVRRVSEEDDGQAGFIERTTV